MSPSSRHQEKKYATSKTQVDRRRKTCVRCDMQIIPTVHRVALFLIASAAVFCLTSSCVPLERLDDEDWQAASEAYHEGPAFTPELRLGPHLNRRPMPFLCPECADCPEPPAPTKGQLSCDEYDPAFHVTCPDMPAICAEEGLCPAGTAPVVRHGVDVPAVPGNCIRSVLQACTPNGTDQIRFVDCCAPDPIAIDLACNDATDCPAPDSPCMVPTCYYGNSTCYLSFAPDGWDCGPDCQCLGGLRALK